VIARRDGEKALKTAHWAFELDQERPAASEPPGSSA